MCANRRRPQTQFAKGINFEVKAIYDSMKPYYEIAGPNVKRDSQ